MEKVQVGESIKGRQTCLCSTQTGEQPESPLCASEPCSSVSEQIAAVCCVLCPPQVVKMKTMQVIPLTLLCVLTASAQVLKFGKCPKPAVQANFDVTRVNKPLFLFFLLLPFQKKNVCNLTKVRKSPAFLLQYVGKWYEIQKLPTAFQKGQCGTATYSLKGPGVIGVLNSELL